MDPPTARAAIAGWLRLQLAGATEVRLPDLTNEAVEFVASDRKLLRSFLGEMLRPIVYDCAQRIVGKDREGFIVLGDVLLRRGEFETRAHTLGSRWTRWLEHVGDRHINIMAMTRQDLLIAAEERERRAAADTGVAQLWRAIADRLKKGQTVGDRFKPADLDALSEQLFGDVPDANT